MKWTDVLLAVWVFGILLQALWIVRTTVRMNRLPAERFNVPVVSCKITVDQAAELAKAKVRALGLDFLGIGAMEKGYTVEYDPVTDKPLAKRECFILAMTRELNGVLTNHALYIEPEEYRYADTLPYETVRMAVDDQGVVSFSWIQPMKFLNTEKESVSIKPFSEIQEIFKKQITIKGVWNTSTARNSGVIGRRIVIEEARLGLMRTVRKDKPGKYLLLPVWDFYGYEASKYEKQQPGGWPLDKNNEHVVRDNARSYLTINAVDGSVIDRGLGY